MDPGLKGGHNTSFYLLSLMLQFVFLFVGTIFVGMRMTATTLQHKQEQDSNAARKGPFCLLDKHFG